MSKNLPEPITPIAIELPDHAPAFNVTRLVSWRELPSMAKNYFSAEDIEARHESTGEWPHYTPVGLALRSIIDRRNLNERQVRDAEKDPQNVKTVMTFAETDTALVLNASRCLCFERLTGSANPLHWIGLLNGRTIELYVGTMREMSAGSQVLARFPKGAPLEGTWQEAAAELMGH